MDSKILMEILNDFKSGKMDYAATSLALITLGCNAEEAKKLMDKYKPEENRLV